MRLLLPLPYQDDKTLYGQITRIDNFGNLITNIHSGVLHTFLGTAQPCFQVGKLVIKKLNRIYAESEEGEPLALINSSNRLEIAVNMGRASEYLGVDRGDTLGTEVRVSRS